MNKRGKFLEKDEHIWIWLIWEFDIITKSVGLRAVVTSQAAAAMRLRQCRSEIFNPENKRYEVEKRLANHLYGNDDLNTWMPK